MAYGGGEKFAEDSSLKFLGRIPIEPNLTKCSENGNNYMAKFSNSVVAKTYMNIVKNILDDGNIAMDCE